MGKGQIFAHLGSGQYSVTLKYKDTDRIDIVVAELESQISAFQDQADALDPGPELDQINLKIAALQKMVDWYDRYTPSNPTVEAWCVDLTEDLSGNVATIEIPGERQIVNIRPGYEDGAEYDANRDGQLQPVIAAFPANFFLNLAVFPGWQTHKPTYRLGTIIADSMDYENDTCSVCLYPAFSSQGNINVNPESDWSECPASPPSGYDQFCIDNPAHPICTNTTTGDPMQLSDGLYENLKYYQEKVNSEHEYESDKSGYQIGEYWAIMGAGDTGDCEDFTLTKMHELINDGWSPSNLQIATCYTETGVAHAVLLIRTRNRGNLVLDNRYDEIRRQDSLPYQWIDAQRAGSNWGTYSVQLESVPIEYMSCNAAAFADGDFVVVEFEGQDYESPKVIGFATDPQVCGGSIVCALGHTSYFPAPHCMEYNLESETWTQHGAPAFSLGDEQKGSFGVTYASRGWAFGGLQRWLDHTGNTAVLDAMSFNLTVGGWTTRQSMNGPARARGACFVSNARAYIVTGSEHASGPNLGPYDSEVFDDVSEYNFGGDSWAAKGNFNETRTYLSGFSADGSGYIQGGRVGSWDDDTVLSKSNHKYDADGDAWISRKGMGREKMRHDAINADGYGYIMDGFGVTPEGGGDPLKETHKFNHVANSWVAKQASPFANSYGTAGSSISILGKGHAYNSFEQRVYQYDPTADSWYEGTFQNQYGGSAEGVCFSL